MSGGSGRLLACASLAALLSGGCVDERAFFISGTKSICTSGAIAAGVLDVAGKIGYHLSVVVQNDLLSSAGTDNQPERRRLDLRKFRIKLDLGQAASGNVPSSLLDFEIPVSGTIQPGGTAEITNLPVIPSALVGYLSFPSGHRPLIIATIQAVAERTGSTIESVEHDFPIELCNGCLVRDIGACPAAGDTVNYSSNECGLPQDSSVVCCTSSVVGFQCLKQSELTL